MKSLPTTIPLTTLAILGLAGHLHAGLIGAYDFTGGSLADSSGNANDAVESEGANPGSGATFDFGAIVDPVRGDVFDLTGGGDDLGSDGGLNLTLPLGGMATGSWSLAMWVNTSTAAYLYDNRNTASGTTADTQRLIFNMSQNSLNPLTLFNGADWQDPTVGVEADLVDSEWHHVAWTYDGTTFKAYLDGVVGTTPLDIAIEDLLNKEIELGNEGTGGGAGGQAGRLIDSVRVYDNAISDSDVAELATDMGNPPVPSVPVPVLNIALNGENLDFTWDSEAGLEYDLVTSPNLDTPVDTWPIDGTNENIADDPEGNKLSIPLPADLTRFYGLIAEEAPPVVILDENFEADNGGFTFVDYSGATGTAWEWGAPDSNNGVDPASVVTEGNNSSVNCWATNLGDFNGEPSDRGFYNNSTDGALSSPTINLTGVSAATLSYAQAIDSDSSADTTVVNFLDVDDSDNIVAFVTVMDNDVNSSAWEPISFAVPDEAIGKNIRIEWRLTTTVTEGYIGWYIDDVMVTD